MCYHTKQTKKATEVQKRFNASIEQIQIFQPSSHFNAFDFPLMPVIQNVDRSKVKHFKWGLIPAWAEEDSIKKFTLNARIETVDTKQAFKNNIDNRCLVIANGYYEWQWLDKSGKKKNKFEIGIGNDDLFAFAGLFSEWTDRKTGEIIPTFTILTTQANAVMSKIHNTKKRMPIILQKEDENNFLNGDDLKNFAFPNYNVDLVTNNLNPQQSLF